MRITGGKVKGTQLRTLQGRLIRPTTSLVRQAIFSILENSDVTWHRVLDLYAGSGALGIEALSREAEWVDFVDQRKKCCDVIKYNLEKAGVLNKAHIYCCSVSKVFSFLRYNYNIIFVDPPYSDPSINSLLTKLAESDLLAEKSVVVLCHSNRLPLNPEHDGLCLIRERCHGDTFVSIYQKRGGL